ncbi:MAG: 4Fe-4S ferredoxin [Deltaproteobacteria bacterium HGW-Deltaproteobacteria-12]|jgi:NAD-dependent dihydropyrimidine dehydrogenase PreA subunit|nr:MAG: 4Fe-4S ferredoxin [Deltaproteobacteria bacterium HGW-Deltaproteobacteria-12]
MKRQIIKIDEEKCTGCGLCIPNCHEQAIQIINGKARLINDAICDGLGACLGECPEGALTLEERDAEPFDEKKVRAHLEHREEAASGDEKNIAGKSLDALFDNEAGNPLKLINGLQTMRSCPGSAPAVFEKKLPTAANASHEDAQQSELTHWPIQLHLLNPVADFFRGKDVVLAADCVAFSLAGFHNRFLKGKNLAIACPKLDSDLEVYAEKIRRMVDEAKINTLTVIMMQVPCCRGLLQIAQAALQKAQRKVPLKAVIISTQGEVLSEEWL